MKRFIAIILALICVLTIVGCDTNPTDGPNSDSGTGLGSSSGQSQGSITPGNDSVINEDGSLKIPSPDAGANCNVSSDTWEALLSKDAILNAMKDNSITTLTSNSDADEYQMFFCAGGRYGSIQKGNYYSEALCCVEDEKVYIYKRSEEDSSWTRQVSDESYDEYVSNHYTGNAILFLTNIDTVYGNAQFVEAEKAYVVQNHVIVHPTGENMTGTLKVQFANEKLYSISVTLTVEEETATMCVLFGSVAAPEIPADFQEGSSSNISGVSPDNNHDDHHEPAESVCNEKQWQRLFGEKRLLDNLMDFHSIIEIENNQQTFLYQLDRDYSRIVISSADSYEEIIISHAERYQRDSKNGQWTRYSGRNSRNEYETILTEKTAVLTQLLTPLEDLYAQASFDAPNRRFTLSDVAIKHETFGSVTADFIIVIGGDRLEALNATIQGSNGNWELTLEEEKSNEIALPNDYVDAADNDHGK